VQAVHAAVKATESSYCRLKYEQICKRRGKKRAIIAIARMIFTAAFHILLTGEVWTPCDLQQIDMPPELREKQLQKFLRRAAKLLVANGIVTQDSIRLPELATV
jgi:transposase